MRGALGRGGRLADDLGLEQAGQDGRDRHHHEGDEDGDERGQVAADHGKQPSDADDRDHDDHDGGDHLVGDLLALVALVVGVLHAVEGVEDGTEDDERAEHCDERPAAVGLPGRLESCGQVEGAVDDATAGDHDRRDHEDREGDEPVEGELADGDGVHDGFLFFLWWTLVRGCAFKLVCAFPQLHPLQEGSGAASQLAI